MKLVLNYLIAERARIANEIISQDFKPETFYRAQGEVNRIDDVLGLPKLLEDFNFKE